MNKTSIEWTDFTWNPIRARNTRHAARFPDAPPRTGTFCTRISPGCTNCYASVINRRFGNGLEYTVPNLERVEFFLDEKILAEPLQRKKPARIFVGDMFDLFHEAIDPFLIGAVFGAIMKAPQHTYQILTKRAARMCEILSPYGAIDNVWLGVSLEDQKRADERIPELLQTPAAVRFLSVEPQLEAIDLSYYLGKLPEDDDGAPYPGTIAWVICGGESGPGARPFNLAWAESLLAQCRAAGVPFFMKQIGRYPNSAKQYDNTWEPLFSDKYGKTPTGEFGRIMAKDGKGGDPSEWPESLRVREFPAAKSTFEAEVMRCSQ